MIVRRRVAFSETDASGRVHFAVLLKWAEEVEHEILEKAGDPVFTDESGWPRARIECDYRSPLVFGDEVEIEVNLEAIGSSSLSWVFAIRKGGGEQAALGKMVTVCVQKGSTIPIDETLKEMLKAELSVR